MKNSSPQNDIESGSESKHDQQTSAAAPVASAISTSATNAIITTQAPAAREGMFGEKWGVYTRCLSTSIIGACLVVGGVFSGTVELLAAGGLLTSGGVVVAMGVAYMRTIHPINRRRVANFSGINLEGTALAPETQIGASQLLNSENSTAIVPPSTPIPLVEATIVRQTSASKLDSTTTSLVR